MYPPLVSLNNQVDVPSTWTDPQEMYPLLFSVQQPSTCTTKDVPSNVFRQRILRRLVLWIFVRGNIRYLRRLVLWNLLFKGNERIKRILRRLVPWILLEERRETQKNSGGLSFYSFGKGRSEWRRRIAQVFEQSIEQKLLERSWEMNQKFL